MLREPLLYLARSELLRRVAKRNRLARRIAARFVAGETAEQAIAVSRTLAKRGMASEIDYLGENVLRADEAELAVRVYLDLLRRIAEDKTDAQLSLKLTQVGLDLDWDLCLRNVKTVLAEATSTGNFLWLDMESSEYTERTLMMYERLRAESSSVGVAIQSALFRSKEDVRDILAMAGTVRLCKGAYLEPPSVAYQDKEDVDRNFALITELLLSSGRCHGLATHDERLIKYAIRYARSAGIDETGFEFQMLYGVRRDLQARLTGEGNRVRVYVPFGEHWYPYLMRRLAERPANLVFVSSNLLREATSRNK